MNLSNNYVWTPRQLQAALLVVRVLGADGSSAISARSNWLNLSVVARADLAELKRAEEELLRIGLVTLEGDWEKPTQEMFEACKAQDDIAAEITLALALEWTNPLWLHTATGAGDAVATELIPDDVFEALSRVIPDPIRREAFLLQRARVVDGDELKRIGAIGEEFVVDSFKNELIDLGARELCDRVIRVSLTSDELGYDVVAPRLDGTNRRVEVKTTKIREWPISVFVTRNEISTGLADSNWSLLVVCCSDSGCILVGWTSASRISAYLPTDQHTSGRWQSARLKLSEVDFSSGLP